MSLKEDIKAALANGPLTLFALSDALKKQAGVYHHFDYGRPCGYPSHRQANEDRFRREMTEHYLAILQCGLDMRNLLSVLTKSHEFQPVYTDTHQYACGRIKRPECKWSMATAGVTP